MFKKNECEVSTITRSNAQSAPQLPPETASDGGYRKVKAHNFFNGGDLMKDD